MQPYRMMIEAPSIVLEQMKLFRDRCLDVNQDLPCVHAQVTHCESRQVLAELRMVLRDLPSFEGNQGTTYKLPAQHFCEAVREAMTFIENQSQKMEDRLDEKYEFFIGPSNPLDKYPSDSWETIYLEKLCYGGDGTSLRMKIQKSQLHARKISNESHNNNGC